MGKTNLKFAGASFGNIDAYNIWKSGEKTGGIGTSKNRRTVAGSLSWSPHIAARLCLCGALSGGEHIMLIRFFSEEDGQTLVEYGMLISLIALVVIAAVSLFGGKVANMWGENAQKFPDPPS